MDVPLWPYAWAMFRLASRGKREAKSTRDAIVELARKEWNESPPKRGHGLWQGSAWMTSAFLQKLSAVHQAHKNLFAPDGPFAVRLQEFATSELVQRMRRRTTLFGEALAEDEDDAQEFKERFGLASRDLSYRGVTVLGFGVPKGIFWLGTVDAPRVWQLSEAERALHLLLPARPVPEPQTIMTGPPSRSLLPLMIDQSWRRDVVRSLMAAAGFLPSATGWTRDGRTFGTARSVDEFLLVEPSVAEVERLRLRQLRGELKPLWVIDRKQIERAAWHFPWLWRWGREHVPGAVVLPVHPRWPDVHTLLLTMCAFHVLGVRDDDEVRAFWASRQGTPVEDLLSVLNGWVQVPGARPELGSGGSGVRLGFLFVGEQQQFAHPSLTALLREVTEWLLRRCDERELVERLVRVWRDHDPRFAAMIDTYRSP